MARATYRGRTLHGTFADTGLKEGCDFSRKLPSATKHLRIGSTQLSASLLIGEGARSLVGRSKGVPMFRRIPASWAVYRWYRRNALEARVRPASSCL